MIGIYKITSPSKRVYIGQSINIESRFNIYRLLHCKLQVKLYRSFKKYGVENHKFEILIECEKSELNSLERYFQDVYFKIHPKRSLNCILTETSSKRREYSDETRRKMSEKRKGIIFTPEHLANMSKARKGIKFTEERRKKQGKWFIGKPNVNKGRIYKEEEKVNFYNHGRKVINLISGEIYLTASALSRIKNLGRSTITNKINGNKFNNTHYIYYDDFLKNMYNSIQGRSALICKSIIHNDQILALKLLNPLTILRVILDDMGVSIKDLSLRMDLHRANIQRTISGRQPLTVDMCNRIEEKLGLKKDYLACFKLVEEYFKNKKN